MWFKMEQEPKHMRELHSIRKKLSKQWQKATDQEKANSIAEAAKSIELEIEKLRSAKKKTSSG